jgi:membrane-bound lytic murein transglycosylase B
MKPLIVRCLSALLAAICVTMADAPALAQSQQTPDARFATFLAKIWPDARDSGVSRRTFDAATAGLTPDLSLRGIGAKQGEFERPLKAYVAAAASPARAQRALAAAAAWSPQLARIEATYGVPREVILAIWGMETDFGRDHGERDVIRSLATLAFLQPERELYRSEFVAALVILDKGLVPRANLKGSWAGAMGNPQFMPSTYLKYAVDFERGGGPDIWTSVPDSLASIANVLKLSGWDAGQPWGGEVRVPPGFDFAALRQDMGAWSRLGFRTVAGAALPARGEAMLFLPVGVGGPAFLLGPNFFVLKAYNFSDAYAMAVSILADRIAGRSVLQSPWPDEGKPLSRTDRARLQTELAKRGFYQGKADGRIGPVTRDAVHAFQRSSGINPADGYPSAAVLARLLPQRP